jgi:hypothetical protein
LDIHAVVSEQQQVDDVVDRLRKANISLLSMNRRDMTLEEAFMRIVEEDAARGDQR